MTKFAVMISVVYEDAYCLIAEKPSNVLVHHAHHSRNKLHEDSLVQLIERQLGASYTPIHRLDRKTSGLVLFAKDKSFVSQFQELFTKQQIEKTYYAVVRGFAPQSKVIDSPVKGRDADVYKEAETHLTTLNQVQLDIPVKPYPTSRYSLVKLEPKTGRLHQLRIHMNKISHPIIGDPKYGDKNHNLMFESEFNSPNLLLHAGSLAFTNPFTQKEVSIQAPFSEEWLRLFSKFDWKNPIAQ